MSPSMEASMERFDLTPEHAERLILVQKRVRDLAIRHPQIRVWLCKALDVVVASHREVWAAHKSMDDLVNKALDACIAEDPNGVQRELVGNSLRFTETSGQHGVPVTFEVVLPESVADLIDAIDRSDDALRDTKLIAKAVLVSRRAMFKPKGARWKDLLSQEAAGTACRRRFEVEVAIEPGFPDPTRIEDYSRLTPELQYNVGLFFLSGLVDLGAKHTIIPKPVSVEGDESPEDCWYARFLILNKYEHLALSPRSLPPGSWSPAVKPDPYALDPDLAEQWLADLEMRVAHELAGGPEMPSPGSFSSSPPVAVQSGEPDTRELRHVPRLQQDILQGLEHIARRPGATTVLQDAVDRWARLLLADTEAKSDWYPKFERYRRAVLAGSEAELHPAQPSATWNVQPSSRGVVWQVLDQPTRLAIATARMIGHAIAMRHEWAEELAPAGSTERDVMTVCAAGIHVADALAYLELIDKSTQKSTESSPPETAEDHAEDLAASSPQTTVKTWPEVQGVLLQMQEQGEQYQSLAALAKQLGSTHGVVRSAIDRSPTLKRWQQACMPDTRKARFSSLSEMDLDRTKQTVEASPLEIAAETESLEIIFQQLIDESSPTERARLHGLTSEQRLDACRAIRNNPGILARIRKVPG